MSELSVEFTTKGCRGAVLAYFTLVYNEITMSDGKLISTKEGRTLIAFFTRKDTAHCSSCHHKNSLGSKFCNDCGQKLIPKQDRYFQIISFRSQKRKQEVFDFIYNEWDKFQQQAPQEG